MDDDKGGTLPMGRKWGGFLGFSLAYVLLQFLLLPNLHSLPWIGFFVTLLVIGLFSIQGHKLGKEWEAQRLLNEVPIVDRYGTVLKVSLAIIFFIGILYFLNEIRVCGMDGCKGLLEIIKAR